jgi:hypothetical protein
VVTDPLERANPKSGERGPFSALTAAWDRWNATMLSLDPASFTNGITGAELADHYGVPDPATVVPGPTASN